MAKKVTNNRIVVAISTTGKVVSAGSVTELASKMGASRTNISDAVNRRDGRIGFNANGTHWVVA